MLFFREGDNMGEYDIIIDNDKTIGSKMIISYIVVNQVKRDNPIVEEADMLGQDIKYIEVDIYV